MPSIAAMSSEFVPLVCPECRKPLLENAGLTCSSCGARFPVVHGIADFSGGLYYDEFIPGQQLAPDHVRGLDLELSGTVARIVEFYVPWIRSLYGHRSIRVLDCGCGNGLSVDLLMAAGFDAWGNDLSSLRKHQWRERRYPTRLVVADSRKLPFSGGFFDVVIASGVIEHLGVRESAVPRYTVIPLPDKEDQRRKFLQELMRVVKTDGRVFLDFPNGAFPIDFWHGGSGGSLRWHSRNEGFLPTYSEIRKLLSDVSPESRVVARSPFGRLQFRQVSAHWYGRLFKIPAWLLLWILKSWPFKFLAGTAMNPFLVLEVLSKRNGEQQGSRKEASH